MKLTRSLDSYKAIFFDAGDTLLTIPAARVLMQQFLAERQFVKDEMDVEEKINEAIRKFYYEKKQGLFEACTPESDREFWIKIYRYVLQRLNIEEHNWTPEEIYQCCHEMYDVFVAPQHYHLFEDVREVLEELKRRNFRLAVISNFAPTLPAVLEDKGILHYFDPVVVSTLVGMEKPDPAIFSYTLELTGLKAEEVLYVGDHDTNDIWAPNQVGIDAVKIKRYDYHTGDGILSLRELCNN